MVAHKMTKQEAIKFFGNGAKLAKQVGVKPEAIYQWGEYPPYPRQCQIQIITNGKLKAEER